MPVITFDGGKLTKEQKKKLIEEITASSAEITKIPKEKFIVLIKENEAENIGLGGETLEEIFGKNR